jgi:cytochrome c peroxidase
VQRLAFSDPRQASIGITGEHTRRNAMSLVNVAYARRLTWAHPNLDSLERQALIPLFGDFPIEMGAAGVELEVLDRLASEPAYERLGRAAGVVDGSGESRALSWNDVVSAIAAFERSLVSCGAPYDRFVAGETNALSSQAVEGMELFFSERTECFHCHNGPMFSDSTTHEGAVPTEQAFHNTGLYNVDGEGAYPSVDTGIMEFTEDPRDMGRFRAPSLRNIALTAPYMHDGSIGSLGGVLMHYSSGGRVIHTGPHAGVGGNSPFKSEFVPGFLMTDEEESALLEFLASLTDPSIADRSEWSNPWRGSDGDGE